MRYPLIKVSKLPPHYKHCMVVQAISFRFAKVDEYLSSGNRVMKQQYLEQIKTEMLKAIDAQFISCQGEQIKFNGEDFIVFKSNFDKKMFHLLINNLFKEVNEYVEGQLDFYYGIIDGMLYLEGREPSLLGSMKMGEDLFESGAYEKSLKKAEIQMGKGYAKYLTSFEEFEASYKLQADNYCI